MQTGCQNLHTVPHAKNALLRSRTRSIVNNTSQLITSLGYHVNQPTYHCSRPNTIWLGQMLLFDEITSKRRARLQAAQWGAILSAQLRSVTECKITVLQSNNVDGFESNFLSRSRWRDNSIRFLTPLYCLGWLPRGANFGIFGV